MAEILNTGFQRAAKASQVFVDSNVELAFASWKTTTKVEDLNTTNFSSFDTNTQQSFDEGISAIMGCDVQFGGDWDANATPFGTDTTFPSGAGNPPGLYPRDDLANVFFVVNRNDQSQWVFPYVRLRQSENSGEVRQKVLFNCTGMNQGIFSYPVSS